MIKKNNHYLCKMETEKCIYFWKENNEFGFLSNFYISNFKDANFVKYNCNEKYFIAHKCLLFDGENDKLYNKIMQASIPYVIKRLGREVRNFDQYAVFFKNIMFSQKFTQKITNKLQKDTRIGSFFSTLVMTNWILHDIA